MNGCTLHTKYVLFTHVYKMFIYSLKAGLYSDPMVYDGTFHKNYL